MVIKELMCCCDVCSKRFVKEIWIDIKVICLCIKAKANQKGDLLETFFLLLVNSLLG